MILSPKCLRLVALAVVLASASAALAETSVLALEKQYQNLGSRPYVVKKMTTSLDGKGISVIGDFDTEDEAKAAVSKLNGANPLENPWFYMAGKRNKNDSNPPEAAPKGPTAKLTSVSQIPSADPGPSTPAPGKSKLAGKTGRGKIAGDNVTIQFLANGEFIVDGEVEGRGKWSEDSVGTVRMETKLASFHGNVSGNEVSGVRVWKDKKDGTIPTDWSITFEDPETSVVGTWLVRWQGTGAWTAFVFQWGGRLTMKMNDLKGPISMAAEWVQHGTSIEITLTDPGFGEESRGTVVHAKLAGDGKTLDYDTSSNNVLVFARK